ncbi:dna polymerase iii subunit alpha : DNA polymerase III, alpha subunit OS=Planctomyces brasiliensis (strain ATCC 49424 / DSM 5305 / JCM 21570 / NBRC 103401 / IFAM 1448) GN=Plabr_1519 PE=4 SV=1: PHP: DNA_pol3_alpha: HHH_6: tRNA_anti-codon [Gemmataceae bacterium]|nr:dna polymerase iii subunit alpha : DNA polymerase III, alpha subunit OS=Planctomyces brasiliensis (strain ATCC 49424 / DSM 5305 / JCM 21570 / NBRC 103401 / IFAM 1448) GN=Plabr_1519 PE=4 SV=1: PHP: DNA_pol3_alpha: HHH_6: tRNA_anti-codon [Gemmataceae bacterium]VTT99428.1 dna polymerase iii subunit alpha : DNA polymerase III, alpha subunit OS=Planctomyces brasiliensis (strain ATCC 49424 / DSM 5305 / JCM 21570 / NBRC 103401 / IFAM 1448) GN=Plabr_1519 PE=4 SV=1: PHP: DNA_pol3_alpha: HHH_6: tRNA_anti
MRVTLVRLFTDRAVLMAKCFCHLHLHTHYSLLDGFNRIPPLVQQTKKLGMTACAITDHGNLYGAIEFYNECKKHDVKPIIGYEAYLAPGSRTDRKAANQDKAYSHLTLLAKNVTGYKNLVKLSSIAFLEGFYYHPRIDREVLEAHKEGLICLSGCLAGEFNQHIIKDQIPEAEKTARWFSKQFGEDYYIELQNNGISLQDQCTPVATDIANKLGIPLVATADAHYLNASDATAHDVLFCINTRRKHDPRKRLYPEEKMPNPYFVRSPDDMYNLFPNHQDAVARSQEIADKIDIQLDFKKRHFPVFAPPPGRTPEEFLRELCEAGVRDRYGDNPSEAVKKRLDHELATINKMGFASYFLIVWDFVRFARESGIPCTARGSGCGALACYALYLSHVCPLEYDLLFERFLDPNRSEAPDIDIDFCQDRRELVIDYVKRKYGVESVAQIGTFGTLAAKNAMKDVGRALDVPLDRVNHMCKLVPMKGAIAADLAEAMASPDFKREYDSDPQVREMVDIALKLEGMNRNVGTHAAGVVIANGPITNYVPVQRIVRKADSDDAAGGSIAVTTQWEMGIIEKVGMLKMDFLGLRNLTVLDNCVRLIKKTRGLDIDPMKFPLTDPDTYKLLQRGDAKGVFQLESEGIRELLKRMKPDNIRDLIAVLALYRPGPLEGGMVDEYIECKHGRRKPVYPHPVMEEVLSETYGVMVYQEQVMRILNRLGGIELAKAYACIKAISKKNFEIINARKADFVVGAKEKGMAEEKATEIFELIVKFGGYGFNKSHTAAYAQIGYQTAYLKTHYTAEYMAALLSSEIDDGNKRDMLVDHIADARKLGIEVLPPDVNRGRADFDVHNNRILFGLTAIKGLGRSAAEEIVRARDQGGKFKDFFDFSERIDRRIVQKSAVERMVMAGAFDPFGKRSAHFNAVAKAFQAADERAADRRRGQKSFLDMFEAGDDAAGGGGGRGPGHGLPEIDEWPEREKLKFEKEALDFYMSSHPLAQYDEQLRRFRTHDAADLAKAKDKTEARAGGMIANLEVRTANKGRNTGRKYATFRIEDFTGSVRCIMWSDEYARYQAMVSADAVHLFEGTLNWAPERAEPDFQVKKVLTIDEARAEFTKSMLIKLAYTEDEGSLRKLDAVSLVLKRYRGTCPVYLSVRDGNGKQVQLKLNEEFRVNPGALKVEELEMVLGPGAVLFSR